MKSMPELTCFTFVPLLTECKKKPDPDTGSIKNMEKAVKNRKVGSQNSNILKQMSRLMEIDCDTEYVQSLQSYFETEHILMNILHPHTFTHKDRERYFTSVFANFPKKSLVFLDPDNGLEVSKPNQRHLLFSEVKEIYDHLDTGSVLMIYQYFPRKVHEEYIRQRCSQLSEHTGSSTITITDNEIIFFLCTKSPGMQEHLEKVMTSYANRYKALSSRTCK